MKEIITLLKIAVVLISLQITAQDCNEKIGKSGLKISEGQCINGVKQGKWVYYYDRDQKDEYRKLAEGSYLNGKREGLWLYYSEKYTYLISSVNFKNDVPHGTTINYYNDGREDRGKAIKEGGEYVNGKKEGVWTTYWNNWCPANGVNGNPIKEVLIYKNGVKDGKAGLFYDGICDPKKSLHFQGEYKNGKRYGAWFEYDKDGSNDENIINEYNYVLNDSSQILVCYKNKLPYKATKNDETWYYNDVGHYYKYTKSNYTQEFYPDGSEKPQLKREFTVDNNPNYKDYDTIYKGKDITYFKNGNVNYIKTDSTYTYFYENGVKKSKGKYQKVRMGFINDIRTEENRIWAYTRKKKKGVQYEYYDDGSLKALRLHNSHRLEAEFFKSGSIKFFGIGYGEIEFNKNFETYFHFWDDMSVKSQRIYCEGWEREGWKEYSNSKQYKKGKKDGLKNLDDWLKIPECDSWNDFINSNLEYDIQTLGSIKEFFNLVSKELKST